MHIRVLPDHLEETFLCRTGLTLDEVHVGLTEDDFGFMVHAMWSPALGRVSIHDRTGYSV
jgi:hypothetical protein